MAYSPPVLAEVNFELKPYNVVGLDSVDFVLGDGILDPDIVVGATIQVGTDSATVVVGTGEAVSIQPAVIEVDQAAVQDDDRFLLPNGNLVISGSWSGGFGSVAGLESGGSMSHSAPSSNIFNGSNLRFHMEDYEPGEGTVVLRYRFNKFQFSSSDGQWRVRSQLWQGTTMLWQRSSFRTIVGSTTTNDTIPSSVLEQITDWSEVRIGFTFNYSVRTGAGVNRGLTFNGFDLSVPGQSIPAATVSVGSGTEIQANTAPIQLDGQASVRLDNTLTATTAELAVDTDPATISVGYSSETVATTAIISIDTDEASAVLGFAAIIEASAAEVDLSTFAADIGTSSFVSIVTGVANVDVAGQQTGVVAGISSQVSTTDANIAIATIAASVTAEIIGHADINTDTAAVAVTTNSASVLTTVVVSVDIEAATTNLPLYTNPTEVTAIISVPVEVAVNTAAITLETDEAEVAAGIFVDINASSVHVVVDTIPASLITEHHLTVSTAEIQVFGVQPYLYVSLVGEVVAYFPNMKAVIIAHQTHVATEVANMHAYTKGPKMNTTAELSNNSVLLTT